MDTLAALNFGIIIALNIKNKGISREDSVVRETVKAGAVAGVLLSLVYAALAFIGGPVGQQAGEGANGARILTFVAGNLFGASGMVILGVIFFIACLNTCVGLISCCSQYFSMLAPKIGYRVGGGIFSLGLTDGEPSDLQRRSGSDLKVFRSRTERHLPHRHCADCSGFCQPGCWKENLGIPSVYPVYGCGQCGLGTGSGKDQYVRTYRSYPSAAGI